MTVEVTQIGNQFTAKNVSNRYKNNSTFSKKKQNAIVNGALQGALPPAKESASALSGTSTTPIGLPANQSLLTKKYVAPRSGNSLNQLLSNPISALKKQNPPTQNQKRKASLKTSIGQIDNIKLMISRYIADLDYEHNGTAISTEERLQKYLTTLESYRSQLDEFMKLQNTAYQSNDIDKLQKKVDDMIERIRQKLFPSRGGNYRNKQSKTHRNMRNKRSSHNSRSRR